MKANESTITQILTKRRILEIPYYQRAYVWAEPQWERFLADMRRVSENKRPYFLGSIILKQIMTPSWSPVGDVRSVIDGQQRLTTLTVFFKVLSLVRGNSQIFDTFIISNDEDESENKILAINHNRLDKNDFERICALTSLDKLEGKGQLIELYNYLVSKKEEITKLSPNSLKDNLLFVGIDIGYNEDEQQIFDTINSLGVTLTTSELLKNYFFDRNNYSDYKKYWEPIFEQDEDCKKYWDRDIIVASYKRHLIDLFFYAILLIKIHEIEDLSTEEKLAFLRMEDLFDSYKKYIDKYCGGDKLTLIKEIADYAQIFKNNINPDCLRSTVPSEPCMDRMNVLMFGLDNTTLIPYVLYVQKNTQTDEDGRNAIFGKLEAYIMRRTTCRSETRSYNRMFYDSILSKNVLSADDFVSFMSERAENCPSDEELAVAVKNLVSTNARNTGILYMLESRLRAGKNFATSLNGIGSYSLEHLMPKKWMTSWDSASMTEDDIARRDQLLLTLGNLAIIPVKLNTSISNSDWQTKLEGKNNRDGLKKCAGGLATLYDVLEKESWSETDIQARAQMLIDSMITIWKF